MSRSGGINPSIILGRVDGFDQDEAESKRDERAARTTLNIVRRIPIIAQNRRPDNRETKPLVKIHLKAESAGMPRAHR